MRGQDLWSRKLSELLATRAPLAFQHEGLGKQIAQIDEQIRSLDQTADLVAGLDQEHDRAQIEAKAERKRKAMQAAATRKAKTAAAGVRPSRRRRLQDAVVNGAPHAQPPPETST